jgi:hypothetical protein
MDLLVLMSQHWVKYKARYETKDAIWLQTISKRKTFIGTRHFLDERDYVDCELS